MKLFTAPILLAALLLLSACGGDNHSSQQQANATGNWTTTLTNSATGQQTLTFNFGMNQSENTFTMSNMNFPVANDCFGSNSVMVGQMMTSGMMSGMQMQITMDMWSNSDRTGNHLNMQVGMPTGNNSQMTGTFALTGVTLGCTSQTGTVTMKRMV